jgi:hypothetical protein
LTNIRFFFYDSTIPFLEYVYKHFIWRFQMARNGDTDNCHANSHLSGGDTYTHYINRSGSITGAQYTVAKGEGATPEEARQNCYKEYDNS